jgi:cytochrome c556
MSRKWIALAVTLMSSAMVVAGIAIADDEKETPLGKVMEQVQGKHVLIMKTYKTAATWKKGQKDATSAAEDLVKFGKEAKPLGGDVIKKMKKTQKEWDEKMDTFLKEADNFAKVSGKSTTTNAQAKDAYKKVSASCTSCHNDFRSDEE